MEFRRNNFDVTNTVDVTDPGAVLAAIEYIYLNLYPAADTSILRKGMADIAALYRGENPEYAACDTPYHDLQHILDVVLASARLMGGYERAQSKGSPLGSELFLVGILSAMFHDTGYLRRCGSEENREGAEFTLTHVSRSAVLLKQYLQQAGLGRHAEDAAQLIHFTGYETPADCIATPSQAYRIVGYIVATADMLAQMADRCYLEKCYDRLYREFLLGGITRARDEQGNEQVVFSSPLDLVLKTPEFYKNAKKRMDNVLGGVYRYAADHFGGENLYLDAAEKNVRFVEYISSHNADIGMLQRSPPKTPGSLQSCPEAALRKLYVNDRRKRAGDRREKPSSLYPDFMDRRKNIVDRRKK